MSLVMENSKIHGIYVTLRGANYLLWSRTMMSVLRSRGLWAHVEDGAPKKAVRVSEKEGSSGVVVAEDEAKWYQDDQIALVIIQASLDPAIHEAYSYCENVKQLWDTLKKVYGNLSNLSRVYEVKKMISNLSQEGMEFTLWFGKYRSLWAELDMLRPPTVDPIVLGERLEQDKVFGLMMNLKPAYEDLIRHLLRQDKLPSLEEVCGYIQREEGSRNLLSGKGEIILANKAFKPEEKKVWVCDHCKKKGHNKDRCWILHPHLKQNRFDKAKANFSAEDVEIPNTMGTSSSSQMPNGRAMVAFQNDFVRKSDLDELIKSINALKESGNSFHVSKIAKSLVIDSGATHHMVSNINLLENLKPTHGHVSIANGEKVPIEGIGSLRLFDKESKAFYMPTFKSNLLSVNKAVCDLNCKAIFDPNKVYFQDIKTGQVLGEGVTKDGLYLMDDIKNNPNLSLHFNICDSKALNSSGTIDDGVLWHARLGHPHSRALKLILPNINFENDACEACILGKHCRSVFPKSSTIYENCFDLVHSDVWSSPCVSRENHKYFVTFIDEKSKFTWITLLSSKDRVLEAFTNFHNYVSKQYGANIKILRTDNGGEYTSHVFKSFLDRQGIIHQTTCPYTPQQNGVAERKNRHLMEVARSMMFHNNVPKRFWSDAVMSACYLINRIPTKVLHDVSPFEVLTKTKPSINHLRTFGCVCFVLVPGEQRNKLDATSVKGMFIGYSTTQKGYKCYIPETRRVMVSREVKFIERQGFYEEKDWASLQGLTQNMSDRVKSLQMILERLGIGKVADSSNDIVQNDKNVGVVDQVHNEIVSHDVEMNAQETTQEPIELIEDVMPTPIEPLVGHEVDQDETNGNNDDAMESLAPPALRRSQRVRKESCRINSDIYFNNNVVAHPSQVDCNLNMVPTEHQTFITKLGQHHVPSTYKEDKEHKVWRDAIGEEHGAMDRNPTWDEARLPCGNKAVTS